jgi:hypothetical protein
MKLAWLTIVSGTLSVGAGLATLTSCNAILGIERAQLESDASSEAGVAGNDGGGDPLTCENYCALMDQNCQGENLEYLPGVCLTICQMYLRPQPGRHYDYPSETPEAMDSLGCRLWHAHAAQDEGPAIHCRHAGLLGTDQCGGPCEPFCRIVYTYCSDDNRIFPYDGGQRECEAVCGDGTAYRYARDAGDLVDDALNMIESGNTLNCRLWHIETAIQKNLPDPHCFHTAAVSDTCR